MATISGFKPSRVLDAELHADRKFVGALEQHARRVVAEAKRLAPVGPDSIGEPEGAYRDSIHVDVSHGRVRVVADDWKASFIEFGTGEPGPTKKYAVLRKAARLAGLRFRSRRKKH